MSALPKELIRDFIKEQNFISTDQVLDTMKQMFKEVLQESLEVELEEKLGYDKYNTSVKDTSNRRLRNAVTRLNTGYFFLQNRITPLKFMVNLNCPETNPPKIQKELCLYDTTKTTFVGRNLF